MSYETLTCSAVGADCSSSSDVYNTTGLFCDGSVFVEATVGNFAMGNGGTQQWPCAEHVRVTLESGQCSATVHPTIQPTSLPMTAFPTTAHPTIQPPVEPTVHPTIEPTAAAPSEDRGDNDQHIQCGVGVYIKGKCKGHDMESYEKCQSGKFNNNADAKNKRCKKCPENSFQNEYGASECLKCPPAFLTHNQRDKRQYFEELSGKSIKQL